MSVWAMQERWAGEQCARLEEAAHPAVSPHLYGAKMPRLSTAHAVIRCSQRTAATDRPITLLTVPGKERLAGSAIIICTAGCPATCSAPQ